MSANRLTNTLVQKNLLTSIEQMGWHLNWHVVHGISNSDLQVKHLHDSIMLLDQMIIHALLYLFVAVKITDLVFLDYQFCVVLSNKCRLR